MRTALMPVRELVRLTELAGRISGELQGPQVNVAVIHPAEGGKEALKQMASFYLLSPSMFLEHVRKAAAEEEASRGRLTYDEARVYLESQERLIVEASAVPAVRNSE